MNMVTVQSIPIQNVSKLIRDNGFFLLLFVFLFFYLMWLDYWLNEWMIVSLSWLIPSLPACLLTSLHWQTVSSSPRWRQTTVSGTCVAGNSTAAVTTCAATMSTTTGTSGESVMVVVVVVVVGVFYLMLVHIYLFFSIYLLLFLIKYCDHYDCYCSSY